jgi:hypothetical protein
MSAVAAALPKKLQARTTVGSLNIVGVSGTARVGRFVDAPSLGTQIAKDAPKNAG